MSLLPKSTTQFSKSEYWNAFFRQRGNKAFEWYGEYPELCGYLHKYVKPKDQILVVGCGNSQLSADLYDVGYMNIINIDVSKVVIKKMKEANHRDRPNMKFEEMDALNMSYKEESYSVVLDKGTTDAIMFDDNGDSRSNALKYFSEVERILRFGGRFICVSLLQAHILNTLLEFFTCRNWMIRVCRCEEAEKKTAESVSTKPLPVFLVVCTKFKKIPNSEPVLEICLNENGPISRISDPEKLKSHIVEIQKLAIVCGGLKKGTQVNSEVELQILSPESTVPRYIVTIVEKKDSKRSVLQYAAFVVPQGREGEYLFGTPEGRQELIKSTSADRLAVISLGRGHKFLSLEQVKLEVASLVCDCAPIDSKPPYQYLSVESSLGKCTEVARGTSLMSGDYIIEDVDTGDELLRRLYFLSSQNMVQSEARLKKVKTRKKVEKLVVDTGYLSCSHHAFMTLGVCIIGAVQPSCLPQPPNPRVLVVGLGGGSLVGYLHKIFPNIHITAIDLDPEMLQIATKHFGLVVDKRIQVEIMDGIDYMFKCKDEGQTFDAVLLDVDNKNHSVGMSCPPQNFVTPQVIKVMSDILAPNGIFILNLVCRVAQLRDEVWSEFKQIFTTVRSIKLSDDLNEIIFCWKQDVDYSELFSASSKKMLELIKQYKLSPLDCLELNSY